MPPCWGRINVFFVPRPLSISVFVDSNFCLEMLILVIGTVVIGTAEVAEWQEFKV